jgi:two-component system response regulator YesN
MHRVILVDDEVLIREAVRENIAWSKLNCTLVGCFQNGREAIDYIREHPVDIVLTDICMPHVDGLLLSKMIAEEFEGIKILIFSGYDNFEYAKQAMRYNVEDYLLKPITSEELCEVLLKVGGQIDQQHKQKQRYSQIATSYQKNKILLKSQVLSKLVTSGREDEAMREEVTQYYVWPGQRFFRIVVLAAGRDDAYRREKALMDFVIFNVTEEIIHKYDFGEVFQGESGLTFFLMAANLPAALTVKLLDVVTEIRDSLQWAAQLSVSVSVGEVVEGIARLPQSYEDALGGLAYVYSREGEIIVPLDVRKEMTDEVDSWNLGEALLYQLKDNDRAGISREIYEMEQQMRQGYFRKPRVHIIMQNIMGGVKDLLEKACLTDSLSYRKNHTVLESVMEKDRLKDALQVLKEYLLEVGDALDGQKTGKGKRRAALALDYMEKHYMESQLGIGTLCAYLDMSPSRFAAMFKEHTGKTFMEVLIGLRMEKAQELMEHTQMKNYEIAERVGFRDPHYFGISFKKATGMTPTEFAGKIRKKDRRYGQTEET